MAGAIVTGRKWKGRRRTELNLKKKPASPAKKGINPFTKEPCVFKAKPASKTVKVYAMKKLKVSLN